MLWVALLLAGYLSVQAQDGVADTLYRADTVRISADNTHRLKLRNVLVPAAVTGFSALCINTKGLVRAKEHVQDALSGNGRNKIKADDYLQYSPMVAVYGLNLCGVKGKHGFKDRTIMLAMSYATMGALVQGLKFTCKEKRPDSGARNSFPSGHTATVFMGAEFLYKEYKDVSPWIGYAGYAVAAATGYLRIYNNRHYLNDVLAGACIGIFSTKFAYWLYPKCFKKASCNERAAVVGMPYYTPGGAGLSMCVLF